MSQAQSHKQGAGQALTCGLVQYPLYMVPLVRMERETGVSEQHDAAVAGNGTDAANCDAGGDVAVSYDPGNAHRYLNTIGPHSDQDRDRPVEAAAPHARKWTPAPQ